MSSLYPDELLKIFSSDEYILERIQKLFFTISPCSSLLRDEPSLQKARLAAFLFDEKIQQRLNDHAAGLIAKRPRIVQAQRALRTVLENIFLVKRIQWDDAIKALRFLEVIEYERRDMQKQIQKIVEPSGAFQNDEVLDRIASDLTDLFGLFDQAKEYFEKAFLGLRVKVCAYPVNGIFREPN